MSFRIPIFMALLLGAFAFASEAVASELIARNATGVHLQISPNGQNALLSYRANGRAWYVLAGGAANARPPAAGRKQVSFRLRRSTTPPTFKGSCKRLNAPVPKLVTACTAGKSSWAVQSWQRALPNFGLKPSSLRAQPELRLSHWSGPTALLTMKADWSYGGKWQHVYGNLTYRAMVIGPGVTPDVGAYVSTPGLYDPARDLAANQEQASLAPGDRLCRP